MREVARKKLEQDKMKVNYDRRLRDNIRYVVDEVVTMKRSPTSTGELTKLQNRYRGPLISTGSASWRHLSSCGAYWRKKKSLCNSCVAIEIMEISR